MDNKNNLVVCVPDDVEKIKKAVTICYHLTHNQSIAYCYEPVKE